MSTTELAGPDAGLASEKLWGDLLLVEDDDVDARTIERMLDKTGSHDSLTLRRARTLAEAVALIEDSQPTVMLADLTLPDAHHLDSVRRLVELAPSVPLIVQTGIDDQRMPTEALEAGAQDYLAKGSITAESLDRALRYAVTRHKLLMSLTHAESRLDRANEELDDVAAVFAHDLRAPVRRARMFAQAMLDQLPDADPEVRDCAVRLDMALGRVDRLILSMLDYEALRSKAPELESVPVADMFREVATILSADLIEADAILDVDIPADFAVAAQPDLLLRVFINIVTNAIRFRRHDVRPRIEVRALRSAGRVTIRISDNGKGILPQDRERVFRVMERLDATEGSGLGLGLPISRRIVESLNGRIEIEEGVTRGTTVLIELRRGRDW
jgi:signal transduction histidine kinase